MHACTLCRTLARFAVRLESAKTPANVEWVRLYACIWRARGGRKSRAASSGSDPSLCRAISGWGLGQEIGNTCRSPGACLHASRASMFTAIGLFPVSAIKAPIPYLLSPNSLSATPGACLQCYPSCYPSFQWNLLFGSGLAKNRLPCYP